MQIWRLKKGSERKFRAGHPWVFSSELAQSPKETLAGSLIELHDFENKFLAYGYGHPQSQISFRTLSLNRKDEISVDWFVEKFTQASFLRKLSATYGESHRFVFAENDRLPGLIIDRYRKTEGGDVFVAQTSTAGMNALWPLVLKALEKFVSLEGGSWADAHVVLSNDSKSRLLEGLEVEPKRLVHGDAAYDLSRAEILIQASLDGLSPTKFIVDFIGGQKTGFFLDQRTNVHIMSKLLVRYMHETGTKELRVLDLCCYIGQWGAQLAHVVKCQGGRLHVVALDASAKALALAKENVERNGGTCETIKADVLEGLAGLETGAFDIVVCDPPAFIKKKKDLEHGAAAYFKMNREAMRKVKAPGLFVSCSCSGLLTDDEFRATVASAWAAAGSDPRYRWLSRGSHSPDHPQRPEFPQGSYLKSWFAMRLEK